MTKAVIFDMFETLITHYETPLYFSAQMAADAGAEPIVFRDLWRADDKARTLGELTFEESLEGILRKLRCFTPEVFNMMAEKRREIKRDLFRHLHPDIIPMLGSLKARGVTVSLISNCFTEEAEVIKSSVLWPYFTSPCLSCDVKLRKPDPAIFRSCVNALGVEPGDCLYIGDGGSMELEAAAAFGMRTAQAVWYLHEEIPNQTRRKPEFLMLENPMDVLKMI